MNLQAHHPMAFPSEEESQQRKANFFAAHDFIEEHNQKSNKTYKLEHNKFSLMVSQFEKYVDGFYLPVFHVQIGWFRMTMRKRLILEIVLVLTIGTIVAH